MKKGIDYIGVGVGVGVGAMIFNEKGEVFLSKRGQEVRNEKGTWEFPGGGVEFGEKLVDAIKREIKEEYNMEIEIIKQFPAADHIIENEHQHWVPTTFLANIIPGQTPIIMEPEKCEAIGWFSMDKLPKPLSIISKIDLDYYKKNINK